NIRVARGGGGKLRAARRTRRLSIFRVVRSVKHSRDRKHASRKHRRPNYDYAADQTVSGRENVVRAFLDAAAARVLATRAGREIFHQAAGSDPLLMAAGSNAVATTCGHSAIRDSRLARSGKV